MIARLRAGGAVLALAVLTLILVPPQTVALAMGLKLSRRLPRLWHRGAAALVGIRVVVRGRPARGRPLLLVANHQSWADIVALGSVVDCSFIAKSQVRGWPVMGWLARLQRTVFVERERRGRAGDQAGSIARRLAEGDAMVLFAEGTTSDGNAVLPFKSALFGAAAAALGQGGGQGGGEVGGGVLVQPVAVAWTCLHGLPLGRAFRPRAAWTGDLDLAPHLAAFLRDGAFDVEITFGEPILFQAAGDRKPVAERCRGEVARMLRASLHPPSEASGGADR